MPRRPRRDVMILDFNRCLRIPSEDAGLERATVPHRCPLCATSRGNLTPRTFSGKLRFGSDPVPNCDDHDNPVAMVPVS